VSTKRFVGDEDGKVKALKVVRVKWEKGKIPTTTTTTKPFSPKQVEVG
jgi:NADPH-dependent glutamate synthase beta subunit-like oxidoreductase